mmetsp:Transcript_22946/g.59959  ORF Transcript_22946/g.59959 Transcript_22946/m.59959 type:complete len:552 (+) Transcript_22946:68-1723(+)
MGRRALQLKSVWDPIQLLQAFAEHGIRPKHAQKIWSFLIRHPAAHWNDVPDLPKAATRLLDEQFSKFTTRVVECQNSGDGETTKLLLELQDGLQIEAVIMHYDTTARFAQEEGTDATLDEPPCSSAASCADSVATGAGTLGGRGHRRATLCVSSQVGCQMGCTFCATGTMGLKGNLTAGEIVEQLVHANSISKIRNIVFMGMGEPLNNYEAVRAAIASMVDPTQWGLSPQRVTVSTVGVVNRVKQLGQDLPGIGLALSLHAPNQELRIQIVPSAKAYHIDKLIESVAAYQHLSKQRIFVEYVLLAGVNDGAEHAHQLGALLSGLKVLLNLIPWNPVLAAKEAHDYSAPSQDSILQFQSIVRTHYQVPTTVRQEKGQDISGACGQLALEKAAAARKGGLGGSRDVPAGAGAGAAAAPPGLLLLLGQNTGPCACGHAAPSCCCCCCCCVQVPCNPAAGLLLLWRTMASFQARLWASWTPVFIPNPPAGGKQWAASPTKNIRGVSEPLCLSAFLLLRLVMRGFENGDWLDASSVVDFSRMGGCRYRTGQQPRRT